jgi:hypothetical protein
MAPLFCCFVVVGYAHNLILLFVLGGLFCCSRRSLEQQNKPQTTNNKATPFVLRATRIFGLGYAY